LKGWIVHSSGVSSLSSAPAIWTNTRGTLDETESNSISV
jgi:hypothetical protein